MTVIQFAPLTILPLQSTRDLGYSHQGSFGTVDSFKVSELINVYLRAKAQKTEGLI
jgi:hypothetical protein